MSEDSVPNEREELPSGPTGSRSAGDRAAQSDPASPGAIAFLGKRHTDGRSSRPAARSGPTGLVARLSTALSTIVDDVGARIAGEHPEALSSDVLARDAAIRRAFLTSDIKPARIAPRGAPPAPVVDHSRNADGVHEAGDPVAPSSTVPLGGESPSSEDPAATASARAQAGAAAPIGRLTGPLPSGAHEWRPAARVSDSARASTRATNHQRGDPPGPQTQGQADPLLAARDSVETMVDDFFDGLTRRAEERR